MRAVLTTTLSAAVAVLLAPDPALARPASSASQPGSALESGVNFDAVTVDDCQHRLALPKAQRPVDPDPRVDLDNVCRNILSGMKAKPTPKAQAHPARGASAAR